MKNLHLFIFALLASIGTSELVLVTTSTNTRFVSNLRTWPNPKGHNDTKEPGFNFDLYRSYSLACPQPASGEPPGMESMLHPCAWRTSLFKVTCSSTKPFGPGEASQSWNMCDASGELPEGERYSPEPAQKLRWRLVDLIRPDVASADNLLSFETATLEVVQAIPISL